MDVLSFISILVGVAILCFALYDLFRTVFVIGSGAGPQSSFVARNVWRIALRLHDPSNEGSHSRMRAVGPVILLVALLVWVLQFTLGWAFVYVPEAFEDPTGLTFHDRLQFAADTVIGKGGNDPALDPKDGIWRALLIPAGLTGILVVSLGLAYILPILAAVAHNRSTAATAHSLGNSVDAMRELAKSSDTGGAMYDHLIALTQMLTVSAERQRSYPVLHYFHSSGRNSALAPAVAKLVLFLRDGAPDASSIDATVREPLIRAIQGLLAALADMGLEEFAAKQSSVDADRLDNVGVDVETKGQGSEIPAVEWLAAYVEFDGWDWDEVRRGDSTLHGEATGDGTEEDSGSQDDEPASEDEGTAPPTDPMVLDVADFTTVPGIGPVIHATLQDAGIDTWERLAATPVDELREVLNAAGVNTQLNDPTEWPEHAAAVLRARIAESRDQEA